MLPILHNVQIIVLPSH